jgi:hypothetical protein
MTDTVSPPEISIPDRMSVEMSWEERMDEEARIVEERLVFEEYEEASKTRAMDAFTLWENELNEIKKSGGQKLPSNSPIIGKKINTTSKQCKLNNTPFEVKMYVPVSEYFESNKMVRSLSDTHWTANYKI